MVLTGIRPVKIVHNLLDKGMDDESIRQNLKENYLIMEEMTRKQMLLKS